MDTINIIISLLTGLAAAIPAVYYLVCFIKKAVREKNWTVLMKTTMDLMGEAEKNIGTGADRKIWVMSEIKALESTLNFDIDEVALSDMIDTICNLTKTINNK